MKNIYLNISVFWFFMLAVCCTHAQGEERQTSKFGFGLNTCTTTGAGFTFRYSPNKFAASVSFIPVYTRDQKLHLIQGFSLMYKFREKKKHDFYAYLGGGTALTFFTKEVQVTESVDQYGVPTYTTEEREIFDGLGASGLGIGYNFKKNEHLNTEIRFGLSAYYVNDFYFLPSLGFSVYYVW